MSANAKWNSPRAVIAYGFIFVLMLASTALAAAPASRSATITLRGKSQALEVYDPASGAPPRPMQIILTSGDVGWVGLPVNIAEHLQRIGYRVIGFNARAYLASFTGKDRALDPNAIPDDYRSIVNWALSKPAFPAAVSMIGVSEGAGLAVIGMSRPDSIASCRGVVALGLPARTSLGWRWTDFTMWITKKDPNEPQAETRAYLPRLRCPLVMIHSTHDEWDSIDSAKEMYQFHPGPKDFIAVDAVNHRFSDKVPEVLSTLAHSLEWLQNPH
jgi:pimeloyl-ACP methyl ester carboxylesterase